MSHVVLGVSLSDDFHDIEYELATWTLSRLGLVHTVSGSLLVSNSGNRTKDNLEDLLPFVRWVKVGGERDLVTDYPSVDCDVFARSRNDAERIAEAISTRLRPRTRLTPDGAIIDLVRARPTPRELPWDNPKIKRIGATYSLGLRR